MKFSEVVEQASELLHRRGRLTYRTLKREFDLDDAALEDLKFELIEGQELAADKDGKMLVWTGTPSEQPAGSGEQPQAEEVTLSRLTPAAPAVEAERRQLTVMFCDLVGSTALSAQLDPEDYRAVVQQYQETCTAVIQRHEGYLAQYLGDGLLVYFGYPVAHEDDARRAVRVGLGIVEAIRGQVIEDTEQARRQSLQVRIGIHTGLVVVGEIGSSEKRELLALGETPNIAARLQGLAEPSTVIISAATQRLIEGHFESQPVGSHLLKGIDIPIAVYHVQSERQSVSPLAGRSTLTSLVGREQEVGLLLDRWEQAKEGRGQVVLLSGEPGIGKSRLAYTLREQVMSEGSLLFEARCSPYHHHSALYPLIEAWQRTLLLNRQDTDSEKVEKLERALALYGMQEAVPLFTALLSLPTPATYPSLTLTPQKQKERTLQALAQLLIAQAEHQATVSVWEDLHWADPSSLEFLSLLIEQIPTTKLLLVLTFRPEFVPSWKPRSHVSQLVLNRLGKRQVEAMIEQTAAGSRLTPEMMEQIRLKTDGVPLFVEEITKSVVEARGQVAGDGKQSGRTREPLAIPATLQEALLARLDRLSTARHVAQLGATLGREFSHELIQAVSSLSEMDLHSALEKLVEAEILYQRGIGEQARYFFKHVLIQDTAYQSLLKSTRQQYHQQIAQVLEERFSDTKETQPELVAHHYTEADLRAQALPYWQQAGEHAIQRSAYVEAVAHLTQGLELLKTLQDTPARVQQELMLQIALGPALVVTKGYAAPEVEKAYTRARELCLQVGEAPQLFPAMWGLWVSAFIRTELETARKLGEQLLTLAQEMQKPGLLVEAHYAVGGPLFLLGELTSAQAHLERAIALYDTLPPRSLASPCGAQDPGMASLSVVAWALWLLGYPDQTLKRVYEALTLAQRLSHSPSLTFAFSYVAAVHQIRREGQAAQEWAEAAITLSTEQGFPLWMGWATILRGWALAEQGGAEEGIAQMRQGWLAFQATGARWGRQHFVALLAEAYGKAGQVEEGLSALAEALAVGKKTEERFYEAELYRLKGELLVARESREQGAGSKEQNLAGPEPQSQILDPHGEAEACFLKAIDTARQQQAKSWELRAATSLARLWQQQGKTVEAHKLLSDVYNWFTEGFDTKDLQEAKALLEAVAEEQ